MPVHSCVWNSFSIAIAMTQAKSEITSCTNPRTNPTAAPPIRRRNTKTSSAVIGAALAKLSFRSYVVRDFQIWVLRCPCCLAAGFHSPLLHGLSRSRSINPSSPEHLIHQLAQVAEVGEAETFAAFDPFGHPSRFEAELRRF